MAVGVENVAQDFKRLSANLDNAPCRVRQCLRPAKYDKNFASDYHPINQKEYVKQR
jgi:hypothetical protein